MIVRINRFFKIYYKNLTTSNILNYTAQLSYGLMLAFLPMLMLFNFAIQFLSKYSDIQREVYHFISAYLPPTLSGLILPTLSANTYNPLSTLSSFVANFTLIVFIIYASMRLIRSFMLISTNLMKMEETRNFIVLWLLAFRNLMFIIICLIVILAFFLESQFLLAKYILNLMPYSWVNLSGVLDILSYLLLLLALFFLFNWCLARLPAQSIKLRAAVPGTLFVFFGWGILTVLFRYFARFLAYEGWTQIVGQGIKILVTIYMISLVILLGVIINETVLQTSERNLLKGSKRYD